MKGCVDFVESEIDDHDYDHWLDTLTEASERLHALETAVAEVRRLCECDGVASTEILKEFDRLGV